MFMFLNELYKRIIQTKNPLAISLIMINGQQFEGSGIASRYIAYFNLLFY